MKFSIFALTALSAVGSVQANPPTLHLFGPPDTTPIYDWVNAKKFCEDKGLLLARHKDWCDCSDDPFGGAQKRWSSWAPISDYENGWVQVADVGNKYAGLSTCSTWTEWQGQTPGWGKNGRKTNDSEAHSILCISKPKPSASGDPHFETWSGKKYDFHGGCDLVLLQNNNFANGLGMNIHVRTSIRTWWSYIETAILQIGDNTLQITGGKTTVKYAINGEEKELETGKGAMGDFAIAFRRVNDHQSQTRVDLGNHGDAISIETFKDFVKVNVKNVKNTSFEGSVGMLGSFPDGKMVGRDGKTIFEDTNAFGQEWMVKPSDKVLFTDVDMENYPLQCTMPDAASIKTETRRLGEGSISEEDAAIACSRVDEVHRDACIFDVMATMDLEMAGSY